MVGGAGRGSGAAVRAAAVRAAAVRAATVRAVAGAALVVGLMGAGLLVSWSPVSAQAVELGGEVRPRFEMRAPARGVFDGEAAEFTSMRARASLTAVLGSDVRAFVQLQDVRVWGTELSTTDPAADALDVHQAWVELGDAGGGALSVRAGRQELSYGGQRLIGALNWAQQARSFDGVRVRVRPGPGVSVDGIAMRLGEGDAGVVDSGLYGVYGTASLAGEVQAYLLYDRVGGSEPEASPVPATPLDRYTLGGRWESAADAVRWRVEGAYQTGERGVEDVSAYLVAARVGTRLGERGAASLWYDRLSGDDDPADGERRVFDTLFATNHKFYGYMDLFLDIPAHTGARGLQDVALKTSYAASDAVALGADLHAFLLTATDGIDTGRLGEELDVTARWAYAPGVSLTGGVSYFRAGPAWSDVLGHGDENRLWTYVMLDVVF